MNQEEEKQQTTKVMIDIANILGKQPSDACLKTLRLLLGAGLKSVNRMINKNSLMN